MDNENEHNTFLKPEKPFLLAYSNKCESDYDFFETEEELLQEIKEIMYYGFKVDYAIEIGSCREINFDPNSMTWTPDY